MVLLASSLNFVVKNKGVKTCLHVRILYIVYCICQKPFSLPPSPTEEVNVALWSHQFLIETHPPPANEELNFEFFPITTPKLAGNVWTHIRWETS